jgi:hypothetical protein
MNTSKCCICEQYLASLNSIHEEISVRALLATSFHVGFLLGIFLHLKMEAICSSKTSVGFQRPTWRYVPEDSTLHNHRCKNLKSYISLVCFLRDGT